MFISLLVAKYFYVLLNLKLLVSCYAKICDENDADMPEKNSKFDPFRFFKKKK